MGRPTKITRPEILAAALELVRREGAECLNARSLAKELGCSTQPVFSNFSSMEEVRQAVMGRAEELYQEYLHREIHDGRYPPYKASGIGYIRFAQEERELFRLLFMRDRTGEAPSEGNIQEILQLVQQGTGLDAEQAWYFHLEMWVYVHGIATMLATNYLRWDWPQISRMLTDAFLGLRLRYQQEEHHE